jgi:hypothetical protein
MNIYSHTTTGTWNESLGLDDEIRFATPKPKSFHQHPAITHSAVAEEAIIRMKESGDCEGQLTSPRWIWMSVYEQRTWEECKSVEMIFHAWHNYTRLANKARKWRSWVIEAKVSVCHLDSADI